jgi:hypothetical protein
MIGTPGICTTSWVSWDMLNHLWSYSDSYVSELGLHMNIQYLPYPSPQVSITCCYYVAFMLPYSVTEAVIGIGAAVRAGQALYAWILHNGKQWN